MPLDGHSYLVSQGWSGKGSGLRNGAISRPLAIPQKKTLSGLGKDRDEAFPFWDHLFNAAAKSIQVKIQNDDDSNTDDENTVSLPLNRTSTGLLSNKRPLIGTPASSGTSTPNVDPSSSSQGPRMSLLAKTKREAARTGLYARFFRGPVLGPDSVNDVVVVVEDTSIASTSALTIADISGVTDRKVELIRTNDEEDEVARVSQKDETKKKGNKTGEKKENGEMRKKSKGKKKEEVDEGGAGEQKKKRKRDREETSRRGHKEDDLAEPDKVGGGGDRREKKRKKLDEDGRKGVDAVETEAGVLEAKKEKKRRKSKKSEGKLEGDFESNPREQEKEEKRRRKEERRKRRAEADGGS